LLFEKQNRILDYQGLLIVFDGLYFLPDNNNLRYIQELLGHKSSKTTEIYTHVTEKSLKNIISPFDTL
jgi:integrase